MWGEMEMFWNENVWGDESVWGNGDVLGMRMFWEMGMLFKNGSVFFKRAQPKITQSPIPAKAGISLFGGEQRSLRFVLQFAPMAQE